MESMYTMYDENGHVIGYAYGEHWVWEAMLTDDVYFSTKEEAIEAWEKYQNECCCL